MSELTADTMHSAARCLELAVSMIRNGDMPQASAIANVARLCDKAGQTITYLRAEQSSSYAKGWNDAMAAAAELNTAELAEAQTWRDAVDDAIATECIGTANSFPDAAAAVEALIEWVMKVAVDPAVSRPAADLRANAFEEAAKVAEGEKCSDAIVAAENIAGSGDAWLVNHICDEIAQAIRAMIDKEASMEGVGG